MKKKREIFNSEKDSMMPNLLAEFKTVSHSKTKLYT